MFQMSKVFGQNIFRNVEMGGNCMLKKYLMKLNSSKYINYWTNMCWNGQGTMILYIKKQCTWKHVMTVKSFIVNIGHGLNGNKFIKPNTFMPHH